MNEMRKLMEAVEDFDKTYGSAEVGMDKVSVVDTGHMVRISDGEHTVTMTADEWQRIIGEHRGGVSELDLEHMYDKGYSAGWREGYAEGRAEGYDQGQEESYYRS